MKKIVILITLFFPFMGLSMPVDGYKDLKFGMTLEQVRNTKLCDSGWRTPKLNEWQKVIRSHWMCDQFLFNNGHTFAVVRFIGGELSEIEVEIPEYPKYTIDELSNALAEKYGEPIIEKIDLIEEDIKEGRTKKRKKDESKLLERRRFADDTVLLRFFTYNGKVELPTLFYSVPNIKKYSDTEESNKAEKKALIDSL
ncbi:hypothetical protein ACFGYE_03620 [Pasteurella multocida]|uniref:hypothetical protein n=1 Tax=Pasteurella multocida TaxID=747 RepID=UPI0035F34AE4